MRDQEKLRAKIYRRNHSLGAKYLNTMASAKKRGHQFTLTRADFDALLKQPCAYGTAVHSLALHVGIDRKDNSLGYTFDNCVACCGKHNQIKGAWASYDQMRSLMQTCNDPAFKACADYAGGRPKRKSL